MFVETNTKEKLMVSRVGAFVSIKDSDNFLPVNSFSQLLNYDIRKDHTFAPNNQTLNEN